MPITRSGRSSSPQEPALRVPVSTSAQFSPLRNSITTAPQLPRANSTFTTSTKPSSIPSLLGLIQPKEERQQPDPYCAHLDTRDCTLVRYTPKESSPSLFERQKSPEKGTRYSQVSVLNVKLNNQAVEFYYPEQEHLIDLHLWLSPRKERSLVPVVTTSPAIAIHDAKGERQDTKKILGTTATNLWRSLRLNSAIKVNACHGIAVSESQDPYVNTAENLFLASKEMNALHDVFDDVIRRLSLDGTIQAITKKVTAKFHSNAHQASRIARTVIFTYTYRLPDNETQQQLDVQFDMTRTPQFTKELVDGLRNGLKDVITKPHQEHSTRWRSGSKKATYPTPTRPKCVQIVPKLV